MKTLKTLIIDDEQTSRQIIHNYATKYCPAVQVIGECATILEAEKVLQQREVDLLFLDIEMPYGNAFDLLERVDCSQFEVIFITAFSQYAVQAFNRSAVHYLLKPINIDELIQAVEKAKERIENKHSFNHTKILLENIQLHKHQDQKLALPLIDGFRVVRMKEILYCEAEDNFTNFYFQDQTKAMICRQLKFYETALHEYGFCRIHRSHLINLEYVKQYIKGKGGTVILENGKELQISNSRKKAFLDQFS